MAFGFGFGFARNYVSALFSAFTPASLFTDGAPGVWYDPSDYGTLFQDSAGTTPVTAVEQPVGLMLDKSQGLVLGPELVTNGGFDSDTAWAKGSGWAIGSGEATHSGTTVGSLTENIGMVAGKWYKATWTQSGGQFVAAYASIGDASQLLISNSNANRVYSVTFLNPTTADFGFRSNTDGSTIDNISVRELPGNHAFQSTSASRPVLSARVNKLLATATLATQSVTTRATAHTLRFEGAGSVTLTGTAIGVYTAGTHLITTTAGTLTLTVLGSVTSADLRETNDGVGVPAYQAVVTSTNYATTGFLPYLKFDGVDDSLSTNSINFTSTDKMSVFAGVRKLSDAASFGVVTELGADAPSCAFTMLAPHTGATFSWLSKGTSGSYAVTGTTFAAPTTNILTGGGNISGDSSTLRINGVQEASSVVDQGTGNYGTYPLYIGRRNNASFPLNGHLYSMIIVGKAVTAGELTNTETYVATKTGVTL